MYKREIDDFIDNRKEDMLELLKSLVAIPSVKSVRTTEKFFKNERRRIP